MRYKITRQRGAYLIPELVDLKVHWSAHQHTRNWALKRVQYHIRSRMGYARVSAMSTILEGLLNRHRSLSS